MNCSVFKPCLDARNIVVHLFKLCCKRFAKSFVVNLSDFAMCGCMDFRTEKALLTARAYSLFVLSLVSKRISFLHTFSKRFGTSCSNSSLLAIATSADAPDSDTGPTIPFFNSDHFTCRSNGNFYLFNALLVQFPSNRCRGTLYTGFCSLYSVQLSGGHSLRTLWSCALHLAWHILYPQGTQVSFAGFLFCTELSDCDAYQYSHPHMWEDTFQIHIQRQVWWVLVRFIAVYSQYETVQKRILAGIGDHRP